MIRSHFLAILAIIIIHSKGSLQKPTNTSSKSWFRSVIDCQCGKQNVLAARIVGGEEANPHTYPWMVGLLDNDNLHCGGSLINDRYILTAGHCLQWSHNLSVILGIHQRIKEIENHIGVKIESEKKIIHEHFESKYFHDTNDIGLLKLKYPVNFTQNIKPICLPKHDGNYSGLTALVTGWGRIHDYGKPSDTLRQAKVKVLTNSECQKVAQVGEHILDSMMCAYEHDIDACQGDSGGPLFYETNTGTSELIGIVSWGIGCAKPGVPGVYTRVTEYLDWIYFHTQDARYCTNRD